MNCEQCEEQLLELLYGELSQEKAALVQSHADDCKTCSATLSELKGAVGYANAFSFDEPPASFDAPIMEAARSHVLREERIARLEAGEEADGPSRGVPLFVWLRGLMTGPQFVATGAMIAIVGFSIWMLREQTMAGDTAMQLEPSPMPPRAFPTQQEASKEGAPTELAEPHAESAVSEEAADIAPSRKLERSRRKAPARRARAVENKAARVQKPTRRSASLKRSDDSLAGLRGGGEGRSRGYAPSAAMSKGQNVAPPQAPSGPIEAVAKQEAEADGYAVDEESKVQTNSYNRGVNLYEAREYAEAAQAFAQALAAGDARRGDSLLYLARSYRQQGNCARAIKPYEAFLRENSKDSRKASAQRELGDCRARIDKNKPNAGKRSPADVSTSSEQSF